MKRNQTLATAALLTGALVAGGAALRFEYNDSLTQPALAQQPTQPLPVQTTSPARRDVSRLIALPGDVHPWQESTLYAKVPGYLGRIAVDKGDRVRAGQVIATIEAPELQADRDQARQSYQASVATTQGSQAIDERTAIEQLRAKAALEKAEADYTQMPAVVAGAKAQLQQAREAWTQTQEQKKQAQADLAEGGAQVDKATADLEGARADQKLADLTYERYNGIYARNAQLIAKQDVDTAESRAKVAQSKTGAAFNAVTAAQHHLESMRAQVAEADARVDQALSHVVDAEQQVNVALARQNSMHKQVQIAQQDLAIGGKQRAVAQSQVQTTQLQADAGRSALSKAASIAAYTQIHAPFDGVITRRFVDPGAFIQTASTSQNAAAIVTVADLDPVRVYINVPEVEARFIRVGTPVKIGLAGLPDSSLAGRIARTTDTLDPKTRTLMSEVDLPNRDRAILPGAYAMAKVVLETHRAVLSLPTAAVGVEKAGKFVFTVENGHAKRVAVKVGFNDGTYTEITEGLHGGEQVVVTGRDALTPNASLQATPWTPPARR